MTETENVVFCTKCGTKNIKINSFCANCGSGLNQDRSENINISDKSVNTNTPRVNTLLNYVGTDDMELFVSKNVGYYNQKFNQITKTGNKRTWNWSAFLFTAYWLIYRKMYLQAGLVFLGVTVVAMIPFIGPLINLCIYVGIGMYANSMYLDNANKKLNEIYTMGYEPKEEIIMKKGGVNIVVPLIIVGITILFIVIAALFFGVLFESLMYY